MREKDERTYEDLIRRSLHLKQGDVILVQGRITSEQLQVIDNVALQAGVFFMVTDNPKLMLSLLDDISLAQFGLCRLSKRRKPSESPFSAPEPPEAA